MARDAEAERLQADVGLGAIHLVCQPAGWPPPTLVYASVVLAVFGVAGVLVLAGILVFNPPAKESEFNALCGIIALFGVLSVALGAAGIYHWRKLQRRFVVCAEGVALWWPGGCYRVPWDEMEKFWQNIVRLVSPGVALRTRYSYSVLRKDGLFFRFDDYFEGIDRAGEHINQELLRRKLPEAAERYRAGEEVTFGRLGISRAGLRFEGDRLDWSAVEGVALDRGIIRIRKHGAWFNWCKLPVSRIPNLVVCLALLNSVVGIEAKGPD